MKLRPCPFCGCAMRMTSTVMLDGKTVRYSPQGDPKHKRGCQLEFASGCWNVGNPETEEGAARKWNRRAK